MLVLVGGRDTPVLVLVGEGREYPCPSPGWGGEGIPLS